MSGIPHAMFSLSTKMRLKAAPTIPIKVAPANKVLVSVPVKKV